MNHGLLFLLIGKLLTKFLYLLTKLWKALHHSLHLQPFFMRLCREASAEHTLRHIPDDTCTCCIKRVRTDLDMPNGTRLTTKRHMMSDLCRAGYACLGDYKAAFADLAIMPYMHEVVNLRAMPDHGGSCSGTIYAVIRTDLTVILDDGIPHLWDLRMHAILRGESEPI